jgi:hypothetical protein
VNWLGPLAELLSRLDASPDGVAWVSARDVRRWSREDLGAMLNAGLLEPGPESTTFTCDACLSPHLERVEFGGDATPFIECITNGRIPLDRADLARWRLTIERLAETLVGPDSLIAPQRLIPNRCWKLTLPAIGLARELLLWAGLHRPDLRDCLERLPFSSKNLPLLAICVDSVPARVHNRTAIPLIDFVQIQDGQVRLATPRLEDLLAQDVVSNLLRRSGSIWTVRFAGLERMMPHRVGFQLLSVLLSNPGREFECPQLIVLAGADGGDKSPEAPELSRHSESRQEVFDAQYLSEIREEISRLDAKKGATGLTDAEESDFAKLRATLRSSLTRTGRSRNLSSASENARVRVQKGVARIIDHIDKQLPALAEHLRTSVQTGELVRYVPSVPTPWIIEQNS